MTHIHSLARMAVVDQPLTDLQVEQISRLLQKGAEALLQQHQPRIRVYKAQVENHLPAGLNARPEIRCRIDTIDPNFAPDAEPQATLRRCEWCRGHGLIQIAVDDVKECERCDGVTGWQILHRHRWMGLLEVLGEVTDERDQLRKMTTCMCDGGGGIAHHRSDKCTSGQA